VSDRSTSGDYRFVLALVLAVATIFLFWYAMATRDLQLMEYVKNGLIPILMMIVGFYFGSKNKG